MALFNMPMATLTDLDPPVIEGTTVGTSTEIYENIAQDSFIARVQTDAAVASFTITSGNTGSVFQIAANGDITTTANAPDYETTPSFTLEIVATDHVGRDSQPFTFTVNILDLDENAPVVTLDTSATNLTQIDEFVSQDTLVATFDVVDNDMPNGEVATTSTPATTLARSYVPYVTIGGEVVPLSTIASVAETADITLSGDPGAQNFYTQWDFISSTNGKIKVYASAGGALAGGVTGDTDVTLTVGISDVAGNYGYANYTVTVIETPDPAIFAPAVLAKRTNTFLLQENTPDGQGQINQYEATGTIPHNWSVHGPDADKFTISSSGALSLVDPLDYEAQSSYSFTVRVTNYFYGPDGEIDQTYFDEEDCTLTVINDTTDDPEFIELATASGLPSTSDETYSIYTPYNGFSYYSGHFVWYGVIEESENIWELKPVVYSINNHAVSSSRLRDNVEANRTSQFQNWNVVLDRTLLTRSNTFYQGKDTIAAYGVLPSVDDRQKLEVNPPSYDGNRDGFFRTPQGAVVVDGRVWARNKQGWFTAAQEYPWQNVEEAVVTTDGGWPQKKTAYAVQVGNYLYAISPDLYTGEGELLSSGFRSYNEVRVFHAPTRANRNNGLKFAYVGSTTIQSWPVPSANARNTGIAYDGTHLWVGRGSILLKFTAPPASNPTAPLVPSR